MNVGFQRSEVTLQVLMTAETSFIGWWLTYPSEKYEFVNGKHENPYMKWKLKKMCETHQPGTASEFLKKNRLNKTTKLSFLDILTCIDDHWWWFTALTFLSPKTQLQNPSTSSWTKKQQFPASKNNLISQLVISLKYPPNQIHDRYASEKSQSDQPLINTVMAPISPLKVDGSESWVAPSMSKKIMGDRWLNSL